MNPIKLSKQLQDTLISYLTTTFDVNRDGQEPELASFIEGSFNQPGALFSGPYLELTPPYKTAETLDELASEGVISQELLKMQCFKENRPLPIDAPLYTHQAASLRKLCTEERNIVVSSGTGSGKTECFLLPILNDLLVDPTPGVRAVLVYPLNALVNDQLDRLRVLLRGTNITFGRYTSELEASASTARRQMEKEWEEMEPSRKKLFSQYPLPNEVIGRDEIQEQDIIPQILITNYAMLEYLLLRPQDNPLFANGKWRFIVLDEAHTYAGAQGIEVGLLIRRLKLRLGHNSGQMRCIATSATLTTDDASHACRFAEALFGEGFTEEDIILGEANHEYVPPAVQQPVSATAYADERFEHLIENVRQEQWESTDEMALLMQEIGIISNDQLFLADKYDPPQFLWEVLRGNEDVTQLRRIMADAGQPVEVDRISAELFGNRLPSVQQQNALYHLIELAAMARPAPDESSLLPARYHLFVRPPQGIWACLNPTCESKKKENDWSKLFATPRQTCDVCDSLVYPLVVCRTCGQVYIRLQKVGNEYLPEAAMQDEAENRYATWRLISENRALADEDEDEDYFVEQAGESLLKQKMLLLCLECQTEIKRNGRCNCSSKSKQNISLHLITKEKSVKRGKKQGIVEDSVDLMNECARCHGRALKDTEIATEISMNALTPLAILTEDLYRSLPISTQPDVKIKAGNGRKLLSFYDSRQGAARFAAFVQDIVNQQAYRRIIREAIMVTLATTSWPDLEQISEKCLDIALEQRVAHNDPEISTGDLPRNSQYLSKSQRQRIKRHMSKQIFAEITTQLRSRQSLENLGLIAIQYFEPAHQPDFYNLAQKLELTELETRTLVEYLLDDLRRRKIVTLPEGVQRDDPIFGRNKFSPRIVRGQEAEKYEVPWIGKTARHQRRQLVAKILRHKGLKHDERSVIQALEDILEWLIRPSSNILEIERPEDGYQLRHDRLFFQADVQWYRCSQCQRLNCRGSALLCPFPHCQGTLQPININSIKQSNFFYNNLSQHLVPMRIEEHTAQLDPQKGRDYQNQFKSGNINMLSCSTTFEMGIDLGDLQAVVMSNIPPTVANYKQRAGRAGRRSSGTAFILAWASNRPHDQTYFKNPAEIIGGHVKIPYLDINNKVIIQRHINAVLLSEFLRHCVDVNEYEKNTGAFFDEQIPGGNYYALLPDWIVEKEDHLLSILERYAIALNQYFDTSDALDRFQRELREKGYSHYETVAGYYKKISLEKAQEQIRLMTEGANHRELNLLQNDIRRYSSLLNRIRGEDLINYLSDRGILPSYSFPLHTVELRIPPMSSEQSSLRLQRNLQQAIREYAPGQEVVANKRIWKSDALEFFGKEPQVFSYHICPTCNHLRLEETPGKDLDQTNQKCPVCHNSYPRKNKNQKRYIQPDGFRVSDDSGQPAGQYVERPYNLMRSALVPRPVEVEAYTQSLAIGYDRDGELLYVNEGPLGSGFKICPKCGRSVKKRSSKCDGTWNGQPCTGRLDMNAQSTLGFKQQTDTLHLKFSSTSHIVLPEPDNEAFWTSLKYALLQGASNALQIERKDIDGVLFPEPEPDLYAQQWRQSIVLYDSVPGGAGHVKNIGDNIVQVMSAAEELLSCDCEKSCYRCLREYSNQWEHHLLDRIPVAQFLHAVNADLQQKSEDGNLGLHPVAAVNPTAWLWEYLERVQQELILYADSITLQNPTTDSLTWLDRLQQMIQRNVKVHLYLNNLPDQTTGDSEAVMIATHLRLLIRRGLSLSKVTSPMPWMAVIDTNTPMAGAIKPDSDRPIVLGTNICNTLLKTSTSIVECRQAMLQQPKRPVEDVELREPADTYVYEVSPDRQKHTEAEYFSEFYTKRPVRSMIISDRYLDTYEKIYKRLGNHIDLAQQDESLEWVTVKTRDGDAEQKRSISQLKERFPSVRIKFELDRYTEHDRYIEIQRQDGSKARIIIGVGLDFIERDGRVRNTFLIFQEMH